MRCEDVDKLLSLYIDDMLDEDTKEDVTSHIDSCERCKEEFEGLKNTLDLLKGLPEVELPPNFEESLNSRLKVAAMETRPNRRRRNITRGIIAVAAGLVVAISIKSGIYDMTKNDMRLRNEEAKVKYDSAAESAPRDNTSDADKNSAGSLEGANEKGAEKQVDDVQKSDEKLQEKGEVSSEGEGILTEDIVIRVQDVCANPQAVERMAIIHDIEVLDVQENSIVVEIDTEEKRKLFYDELSKLGKVENLGSDRDSTEVKVTILSK